MAVAPSPRPIRRSGVVLPEDPSDEELARNWTLSESERREVLLCRGWVGSDSEPVAIDGMEPGAPGGGMGG